MPFSGIWHTILDEIDEVPPTATFRTPLSDKPFRIEDAQEHRLLIAYRDQETTIPSNATSSRPSTTESLILHNPSI